MSTDPKAIFNENLIESSVVTLIKKAEGYFVAAINNPPLNLLNPEVFAGLILVKEFATDNPEVKVLVFESAVKNFFMAHIDTSRLQEVPEIPGARNIIKELPLFSHWLTTSPVITIGKIRGRARGVGSELLCAMDMRFASREDSRLCQLEVGFGLLPGGGGIEWLPRHTGRGRALEIILSADDFDAETAELYGWINRAVTDEDLDDFVDELATRIGKFSGAALAAAKALVIKHSGIPTLEELGESFQGFLKLASGPDAVEALKKVRSLGWGTPETEWNLPNY
ncbi:enoyl-CoA hydratase/isomerase family protein [Mucilaginibacter polytrichastri]|uniref:Enoyl-CoA hydratase n=1 Tax=Mucilaginibacter polytrichastri TaxID=1302689 RepID=A0A1Q5ZY69_9SPHI|nr:enoyl-CoA hydratase/isomerase family protein [Mucilaginibacter polytrichastri]OKS86689.1 hypothetical protein RG47T_2146 [Mucilaginibacter polytrichastri]SFS82196.1 Enoyl-CoA hydratase/carnithine racemase [Mucilaginibacter polytrichastri]